VVVCYLDTGAYEHYRVDASEFPGWHERVADLPDRPDPPDLQPNPGMKTPSKVWRAGSGRLSA
jgi:hypothetical protein